MDRVTVYDAALTISTSAAAGSSEAAYSAWAAELGVSATATLQNLSNDDQAWPIEFAVPPVSGYESTVGFFSSEGGLGLYRLPPTDTAWVVYSGANVGRMIGLESRPNLLLSFRPNADLRSEGVRIQRSGQTSILAGRLRLYTTQTYISDFALRLTAGAWTLILTPLDQPVTVNLYSRGDTSNAYWTAPVAAGNSTQFDFTATYAPLEILTLENGAATVPGLARPYEVYRQVRFDDILRARPNYSFNPAARGRLAGTVKKDVDPVDLPLRRRVRLYRDVDGLLIAETWSRESDGAYVFDYIEEDQAYTVIAIDHEHNYRAVVADNLTLANGGLELIA